MDELLAIMLSWAMTLTGYPMPDRLPVVQMVPHKELVSAACNGRECRVLGWFPPGQTIYLDDRLSPAESTYASAVLLHEIVHYLQQESKHYPTPYSCADALAMEHEAYGAQREFFLRYGIYQPVGISMHNVGCVPAHND